MTERNARQRRVLDPARVVLTLEQLRARIEERFPGAGLARVCGDLTETAKKTQARARALARPYLGFRLLAGLVIMAALLVAFLVYQSHGLDWSRLSWSRLGQSDPGALAQGIQAMVQLGLFASGAVWFVAGLETRLKRARTLRYLYELRAFAHVIDMHQLTKDPSVILNPAFHATAASPQRAMNEFQLSRYLDYCSEMLALTAKLAALYAAHSRDPQVIEAVNDVESLTSDLGRKIWQKITILSQLKDVETPEGPPIEE